MTYSIFLWEKSGAWTLSTFIYSNLCTCHCDDRTFGSVLCLDIEWKRDKMIQYYFTSGKKSWTLIPRKSSRYSYCRRSGYSVSHEFFSYCLYADSGSARISRDEGGADCRIDNFLWWYCFFLFSDTHKLNNPPHARDTQETHGYDTFSSMNWREDSSEARLFSLQIQSRIREEFRKDSWLSSWFSHGMRDMSWYDRCRVSSMQDM